MDKICPKHNKELTHFEGISKKTGRPYENWKCTAKTNGQFCDIIIWADASFNAPQKPQNAPERTGVPTSDVRSILQEINEKLDKVLFAVGNHN